MCQPSLFISCCQWCRFHREVPPNIIIIYNLGKNSFGFFISFLPGSWPIITSILSALSNLGSASAIGPKNALHVSGRVAQRFIKSGWDNHYNFYNKIKIVVILISKKKTYVVYYYKLNKYVIFLYLIKNLPNKQRLH